MLRMSLLNIRISIWDSCELRDRGVGRGAIRATSGTDLTLSKKCILILKEFMATFIVKKNIAIRKGSAFQRYLMLIVSLEKNSIYEKATRILDSLLRQVPAWVPPYAERTARHVRQPAKDNVS